MTTCPSCTDDADALTSFAVNNVQDAKLIGRPDRDESVRIKSVFEDHRELV